MANLKTILPDTKINIGDTFSLPKEESRHLVKSLRAKIGEEVDVFDGNGKNYFSKVVDNSNSSCKLKCVDILEFEKNRPNIILLVSMPKAKAMDSIIATSVEIGASAIIPTMSKRCEVKLDKKEAISKREKFLFLAKEALKQSSNPFLLDIKTPCPLNEAFEMINSNYENSLKIITSLETKNFYIKDLYDKLTKDKKYKKYDNIILAVGPEGDFTKEEYEMFAKEGFLGVSLGSYVLRSKTACMFALSVVKEIFR